MPDEKMSVEAARGLLDRMRKYPATTRFCVEEVAQLFVLAEEGLESRSYDSTETHEHIATLERQLTAAQERIGAAPHAAGCSSLYRFIHVEPCRFWITGYCHGEVPEDSVGCRPEECNCWKSAAMQDGGTDDGQK